MPLPPLIFSFFFFNDTATTEIYTLSLHDALPISRSLVACTPRIADCGGLMIGVDSIEPKMPPFEIERSEEHTSELQSHLNIVCRLLPEKKKTIKRRAYLV